MQKKTLFLPLLILTLSLYNQLYSQDKPNIVYILADDLGYGDLSCYGQEKFQTPNIDKLATNGMRFTQHYSGSTVCAPSRSCLITGQHTGHTDVRGNAKAAMKDETVSIGEIMKQAGYSTGAFGKWGVGELGSEGEPNLQGFDEFVGYLDQGRAHRYYPDYIIKNGEKIFLPGNDWLNTITYSADYIHEEALKFIDDHHSEPFFLYLPYCIPHAELLVPEDSIIQSFRGKLLPEKSVNGKDYIGPGTSVTGYASQTECHATFAAMVARLDYQVRDIVQKLEDYGLTENTLIIFTSDNGPHSAGGGDPTYFNGNGDFRGIKRDLYEGGIRVPHIASWKGTIEEGVVSNHISSFWDFLPTCAEIAGVDVPESVDGISYLPELKGEAVQKKHDYLYWEFYEKNGRRAVRSGKWKAVQYSMKNNPNTSVKLFDLDQDISETTDISAQYPDTALKMLNLMELSHERSDRFNFKYEDGCSKVTIAISQNGVPVENAKLSIPEQGDRISWTDGKVAFTGLPNNNTYNFTIELDGEIITSGDFELKNNDFTMEVNIENTTSIKKKIKNWISSLIR